MLNRNERKSKPDGYAEDPIRIWKTKRDHGWQTGASSRHSHATHTTHVTHTHTNWCVLCEIMDDKQVPLLAIHVFGWFFFQHPFKDLNTLLRIYLPFCFKNPSKPWTITRRGKYTLFVSRKNNVCQKKRTKRTHAYKRDDILQKRPII